MKRKHIHALYLGSLILAFVLGGVVTGLISVPGFSMAAGVNRLSVGGDLIVSGKATLSNDVKVGGIISGNGSGLTNILPPRGSETIIGPVATLDVPTNTFQSKVACQKNTSVTGGGCKFSSYGIAMTYSSIPHENGWLCEMPPPPASSGVDLTSSMTSLNAPAPNIVAASSQWPSSCNAAWVAFDDGIAGPSCGSSSYVSGDGITSGTLSFGFGVGNAKISGKYILVGTAYDPGSMPKNWKFEGSNDGVIWTILDTRTNESGWAANQVRSYTFSNSASYRYYRLNVLVNNGFTSYWSIKEMQIVGSQVGTMRSYALCQESR